MNHDQYSKLAGINATAIKAGAQSMLAMRHAMTGGTAEETAALRWGLLTHAAILEPKRFKDSIAVFDGDKRSGAWRKFKEDNASAEWIISSEEASDLLATSKAVHANKDASDIISLATKELTLEWTGTDYGNAKARLDGYSERYGILELKTARCIEPSAFGRQFVSMRYDLQCGWYVEGVTYALLLKETPKVTIIAVSNEPPYDVAVYAVPSIAVTIGRKRAREIAARYRACEQAGSFPGVSEVATELRLPDWYAQDEVSAMWAGLATNLLEGDE